MRIDVHAHYWTEDYIDLLTDLGRADARAVLGLGAGGGAELEARLRLMDRAGVEMQVLSACSADAVRREQTQGGQGSQVRQRPVHPPGPAPPGPLPRVRRAAAAAPRGVPRRDEPGPGRAGHGRGGDEHHRPGAGAGRPRVRAGLRRAQPQERGAVPASGRQQRLHAPDRRLPPDLDGRRAGRGHDLDHAPDHARHPGPLPEHHDHQLPPRRSDADAPAASRRPVPLGSTGHAGTAQRGRAPDVVRHRRPRARPRPAVRDRLVRRGPAPPRNRLPLRKRRHLHPRGRLHQRPADRPERRPRHPRPERQAPCSASGRHVPDPPVHPDPGSGFPPRCRGRATSAGTAEWRGRRSWLPGTP